MNEKSSNQKNSSDLKLLALATLLHLEKRLRWANLTETRFIAVNETKELVDFTQSVLWESDFGSISDGKITAISNTAIVETNAPFVLFFKDLIKTLTQKNNLSQFQIIQKADISNAELKKDWDEWLPSQILWCPLHSEHVSWSGGLILIRKQPWSDGEKNLLEKLTDAITHSLSYRTQKSFLNWKQGLKDKKKQKIIAILLVILCFFPFRASVLAPAEVIAKAPSLIRSPLDGIVEKIHVKPNKAVKAGDVLITFDQAELKAQINVIQNAVKVAETELRQISQEAMGDTKAMARIAAAQGRLEKEKTELAYVQELLSRTELKAPSDGVVIFEDAYDWLGRPVTTGERIMLLANPESTEIEIQLNVHDRISLPEATQIRFFSNATPHKPHKAILSYSSYRATKTQDDLMAYRLKGTWDVKQNKARLGQKGTAKLYGYRRPLIWQILRIPLLKLRQWTGF